MNARRWIRTLVSWRSILRPRAPRGSRISRCAWSTAWQEAQREATPLPIARWGRDRFRRSTTHEDPLEPGAPSPPEQALESITRPVRAAASWAEDWLSAGVTGTNGKTSTTLLLAEALREGGSPVVAETTLGIGFQCGEFRPRELGKFVTRMHEASRRGVRHAALEVTSEALASGWARAWRFDLGVFTNLSQDHLDAHRSFEHYLASKAQLFVQ